MDNLPPGAGRTHTEEIDMDCQRCEYVWVAVVTHELGTIVEDDYMICPECGLDTLEPYFPEDDDDER